MENAETRTETFEDALARFVAAAQANIDAYYAANYSRLTPPKIEVDPNGVKYVRVVKRDSVSGSAFCFVERETGNVLKCDGWKRPAKGVRGSIYATDFAGYGINQHGANYAR